MGGGSKLGIRLSKPDDMGRGLLPGSAAMVAARCGAFPALAGYTGRAREVMVGPRERERSRFWVWYSVPTFVAEKEEVEVRRDKLVETEAGKSGLRNSASCGDREGRRPLGLNAEGLVRLGDWIGDAEGLLDPLDPGLEGMVLRGT